MSSTIMFEFKSAAEKPTREDVRKRRAALVGR